MLLFKDDLSRRKRIPCEFMAGLRRRWEAVLLWPSSPSLEPAHLSIKLALLSCVAAQSPGC